MNKKLTALEIRKEIANVQKVIEKLEKVKKVVSGLKNASDLIGDSAKYQKSLKALRDGVITKETLTMNYKYFNKYMQKTSTFTAFLPKPVDEMAAFPFEFLDSMGPIFDKIATRQVSLSKMIDGAFKDLAENVGNHQERIRRELRD